MLMRVLLAAITSATLLLPASHASAEAYSFSTASLYSSGIGMVTAGAGLPQFLFDSRNVMTMFQPYCILTDAPKIGNLYEFFGKGIVGEIARVDFLDSIGRGGLIGNYRDLCSFIATSSQGRDGDLIAVQQRLQQAATPGTSTVAYERQAPYEIPLLNFEGIRSLNIASASVGGAAPLPETGLLLSFGMIGCIVGLIAWKGSRTT